MDEPDRVYWRGAIDANDYLLGDVPQWVLDEPPIPPGHVEASHNAFARLHREFEKDVWLYNDGKPFANDGSKYTNVHEGVKHMQSVEAAVESAGANSTWVNL